MGITFLLLTVVVQAALGVVAHTTARSIVDGGARAVARDGGLTPGQVAARVEAAIPGVDGVEAQVTVQGDLAVVSVAFRWSPPGPNWSSIPMQARSTAVRIEPP